MSRRPAAVLAGVVVLVVGILVGLWLGGGDDSDPSTAPSTGTSPSGQGVPTTAPAAVETSRPSIDTHDVEMYDYLGGLRLPRSPTAGPRVLDGNLASGFTRTPLGAILAAVNIAARTAPNLGAPVYEPTINNQVIGVDKPALLAAARRDGAPSVPRPGQRIAGSDSSLDGWRIESYTPDQTVMRYLISQISDTGDLVAATVRVELHWIDDDWRVVAPAGGDWGSAGEQATSTSTYLPFTS